MLGFRAAGIVAGAAAQQFSQRRHAVGARDSAGRGHRRPRHVIGGARGGVHQHQRGDSLGVRQGEAQRDHAAHGVAEKIAARHVQGIENGGEIVDQLLEAVGIRLSGVGRRDGGAVLVDGGPLLDGEEALSRAAGPSEREGHRRRRLRVFGGIGQTLSVLVSRQQGARLPAGQQPAVGPSGNPLPNWTLRPLDWQKEGGARLFRSTSEEEENLPGRPEDEEEEAEEDAAFQR